MSKCVYVMSCVGGDESHGEGQAFLIHFWGRQHKSQPSILMIYDSTQRIIWHTQTHTYTEKCIHTLSRTELYRIVCWAQCRNHGKKNKGCTVWKLENWRWRSPKTMSGERWHDAELHSYVCAPTVETMLLLFGGFTSYYIFCQQQWKNRKHTPTKKTQLQKKTKKRK